MTHELLAKNNITQEGVMSKKIQFFGTVREPLNDPSFRDKPYRPEIFHTGSQTDVRHS